MEVTEKESFSLSFSWLSRAAFLSTSSSLLPHSPLPTQSLPATLPTAHCPLPTAHCPLAHPLSRARASCAAGKLLLRYRSSTPYSIHLLLPGYSFPIQFVGFHLYLLRLYPFDFVWAKNIQKSVIICLAGAQFLER
ncbi:uncharacterized protein BO66DRAFT_78463 [Aspergillus aculeatinus CBS 121060]|uniref:Uncharacterized protein n=1 Tax=Aspergillus aculeatinus CBS 121060 TaxID=1448322 RepID=A0ACD1HAK3_9EURO|nr:hypothetical protein BO66DRAFT_78463 [Aspergillus aculeatinus CBS 121060]RAH70699.1 hypothetical protein BO66DRAFT_78463 [Aspergillus aculeatinus CBS 121060]